MKLRDAGINSYEFLDAIDGKNLKEKYNEYQAFCSIKGKNVLLGALPCYGCLASHCKFFQSNPPGHYIVFEDDIYFHSRFMEMIGALPDDTINRYDVLYLGYNNYEFSESQASAIRNGEQFLPVDKKIMTHGGYGIMYGPRAMKHFKSVMTMDMPHEDVLPNDNIIWKHAANNLRSAILNPPLVIPEVRMSNIRDFRDLDEWCRIRMVNPDEYVHLDRHSEYIGLD